MTELTTERIAELRDVWDRLHYMDISGPEAIFLLDAYFAHQQLKARIDEAPVGLVHFADAATGTSLDIEFDREVGELVGATVRLLREPAP